MDIEIDTPRGWLALLSFYNSREILVYSDMFSTKYVEYIQALANNPMQAKQVKLNESEGLALSYAFLKKGETNSTSKANVVESTLNPHRTVINKTCLLQDLKSLAIPYLANQPANLQLWNDSFCPIFIFGINKFLEEYAKKHCMFFIQNGIFHQITQVRRYNSEEYLLNCRIWVCCLEFLVIYL